MKIVYINKGNTYYLNSVISTTAEYNKDVVLIGNSSLKKYARKNIYFEPFYEYREKFGYKHISVNTPGYEEFCIERWFILKNYMVKNKINEVWYSDSDNIIYENIETFFLDGYDCLYLKNINHINPHLIYLNLKAINALCIYLKDFYSHINQKAIDRVKNVINSKDHISDMYLIHDFIKISNIKSKELISRKINTSYDKNIYFIKGFPYLGKTKLLNVHFSGNNKYKINNIYFYLFKFNFNFKLFILEKIGKIGIILKSKFPKIYKILKPYFPDKNQKLKVCTVYSESHQGLFENYFLPSLKNTDLELISQKIKQEGSGAFAAKGWKESMLKKVDLIIQVIIENMGDIFVYSDVDIIFFGKISNDLRSLLKDRDILFQTDSYDENNLCAGFFVCRANDRILNLWQTCKARIQYNLYADDNLYDQDWINIILKENPNLVKFGTLPLDKYYSPREMVNLENIPPIPKTICTYHANYIIGINNKEQLLSKAQQIINEGKGISRIRYYYKYKINLSYLKFNFKLFILEKIGKIGIILKSKFPQIYKLLKVHFPDKK